MKSFLSLPALISVAFILASVLSGCFGTGDSKAKEDLDVKVDENGNLANEQAESSNIADMEDDTPIEKRPAPKSGQVSPVAVIKWQKYFKAAPSPRQRSLLAEKLKSWKDTENPQDLVLKGRNEAALGHLTAAETSFRKAIRLDENNLAAQLELASIYLRQRRLSPAFDFLAQVRDGINMNDGLDSAFIFRYRYTLALAYMARGERDKGHGVLSDLIGLDKSFTPAYAALASSYLEVGKTGVAEFIAKRGIDRGHDDPGLYNIMGVIAQRKGRHIEAREWFNKSIKAGPTYAPALVNRGNLNMKQYEYDPAEQDLLRALKIDPNNVEALVALGIVQKKTGRIKDARASFVKAIDLDPENALARFNLGVLMVEKLGRPNNALRLFNEVIQIAGSRSDIGRMAGGYISDIKDDRVAF